MIDNTMKPQLNRREMSGLIVVAVAWLSLVPAYADIFTYTCKLPGESLIVKIDDAKNILRWREKVYKLKEQPDCAKFGWRAEREGEAFNFCTATKGGGGIEMNNGTVVQCQLNP